MPLARSSPNTNFRKNLPNNEGQFRNIFLARLEEKVGRPEEPG
jgi:hypothetical protein